MNSMKKNVRWLVWLVAGLALGLVVIAGIGQAGQLAVRSIGSAPRG